MQLIISILKADFAVIHSSIWPFLPVPFGLELYWHSHYHTSSIEFVVQPSISLSHARDHGHCRNITHKAQCRQPVKTRFNHEVLSGRIATSGLAYPDDMGIYGEAGFP